MMSKDKSITLVRQEGNPGLENTGFNIESKKKTSLSCVKTIMTVVCEEEIHYFVCVSLRREMKRVCELSICMFRIRDCWNTCVALVNKIYHDCSVQLQWKLICFDSNDSSYFTKK